MDAIIRSAEGCDPDPFLLWDSVWSPRDGAADYAMAAPDEKLNRGGLSAKAALATAVTLCLFTDKRVPKGHPLAWLADGATGGYWGDGVDVRADLGESELGSLLWLLRRAPLDAKTPQAAKQFAIEALAPLLTQGACARIDVQSAADPLNSRLDLTVQLYAQDGSTIYSAAFALIWKQLQT